MTMVPTLRPYRMSEAAALTDIFYDAVHAAGAEHDSREQVSAWAPLPKAYERWQERFAAKPPLVALVDGAAAGFVALETTDTSTWLTSAATYRGMASSNA